MMILFADFVVKIYFLRWVDLRIRGIKELFDFILRVNKKWLEIHSEATNGNGFEFQKLIVLIKWF